jgi:subtilisin family serine protease
MSKALIKFLLVVALLLPRVAESHTITVAVIDSGIDADVTHLCKLGNKSFVPSLPNPLKDEFVHGTHIAGIINTYAGDVDYCMVAIKFFGSGNSDEQNVAGMLRSLRYAIDLKVDFINVSAGGPVFEEQEYLLIKEALDKGIKVVAAAGNEHDNLDKDCNYFPACYDHRLVIVGNRYRAPSAERSPTSNYGNIVNRWEVGVNVLSTLPNGRTGYMSGTSQATAIATGKLVREAALHK